MKLDEVDAGDIVVLPGADGPTTVDRVWWNTIKTHWELNVRDDDGSKRSLSYPPEEDVTLVERPGFGPADKVYEIGDRVQYRFGGSTLYGVVSERHANPTHPTNYVYVIQNTTKSVGYAVAASMRPVASSGPIEIGQRWKHLAAGRTGTVVEIQGPLAKIEFHRGKPYGGWFVLADPFWSRLESPTFD